MRSWLDRQLHLIDFTLASLARRKSRNLGLFVVYTLLVFVLASLSLFASALRSEAALVLAGSPEVVLQRMVAGRHDLIPPGYLERIGRVRGVQKKEARLWAYYRDPQSASQLVFMARPEAEVAVGSVMLGSRLAASGKLKLGDTLAFTDYRGQAYPLRVASLLTPDSGLQSATLVLLAEADFRAFFGYPAGHYTDIALAVRNPLEVANVASKLAAALPDARPILRDEMLRTYEHIFDWREGVLLTVLAGAILAFAMFAWAKAAGLSAEEKREIGILKAIGWETSDVIRMKIWESLLLSLAAFSTGLLAAWVHVFQFGAPLFAPVLKGWSVVYPEFALPPAVDGLQVATLFFFTVFPYTAAVLVPIWRAAITDPDTVMR